MTPDEHAQKIVNELIDGLETPPVPPVTTRTVAPMPCDHFLPSETEPGFCGACGWNVTEHEDYTMPAETSAPSLYDQDLIDRFDTTEIFGREFARLADMVTRNLRRSPERSLALRELLEAYDSALRAHDQDTP